MGVDGAFVVDGLVVAVGCAVVVVGTTVTTALGNPLTAAVEGDAVAAPVDGVVDSGSADAAAHPASETPTRPTSK